MTGWLEASVDITVPFHDADPAGVVWHGNYFRYFELARCELLERMDYDYAQMARSGCVWPVVDLNSRFNKPVKFQDKITVVARLVEWEYRLMMRYRVLDANSNEAARAMTIQVPVDLKTGELMIGVPADFEQRVKSARAAAGLP